MLRVEIEINVNGEKIERTFRTNDSGDYLFTGVSENTQISCDYGFHVLPRIKKCIRKYIVRKFSNDTIGKIKYKKISSGFVNA